MATLGSKVRVSPKFQQKEEGNQNSKKSPSEKALTSKEYALQKAHKK